MSHLGVVEDTLFVPMLGRIYASEHCPQIIYDKKALELKEKLPSDLQENGSQSQYTLLASAVRSANMDRFIRSFLKRRPDGVIVQLVWRRPITAAITEGPAGMPLICHTSLTTGRNCSRSRSVRPILLEMLLQRIGSDKFARICPTPLSLLQQADCFTILRKIRLFPCFVCSDNSEK